MSQNIEWAHAKDNAFRLIQGDEDAGDGNTPEGEIDGSDESGQIGLVIDGCAVYGQPADLLELLSDAVSQISAHLAGQS